MPCDDLARSVQSEKFPGNVLHSLFGPRAHVRPVRGAQPMNGRDVIALAYIACDAVDLADWQIQTIPRCVFDLQVLTLRVVNRFVCQATVDADPVVDMHHIVTLVQLGEERFRGGGFFACVGTAAWFGPTEYLRIGEQDEGRLSLGARSQLPPLGQCALHQSQTPRGW